MVQLVLTFLQLHHHVVVLEERLCAKRVGEKHLDERTRADHDK